MPDRETVIKGVHDARRYFEDREWVDKSVGVHIDALNDALELLKEQLKTKVVFMRNDGGYFQTECGNCGTYLDKAYSRCPKCQKELDWNSNQG